MPAPGAVEEAGVGALGDLQQRVGEVARPRRAADLVGRRRSPRRARRRGAASSRRSSGRPRRRATRCGRSRGRGWPRRPRARPRASCGRRPTAGWWGRTRHRGRSSSRRRRSRSRGARPWRLQRPRRARDDARRGAVEQERALLVGLGAVDVRVRRAVDDGLRADRGERLAGGALVGDVEHLVAATGDVEAVDVVAEALRGGGHGLAEHPGGSGHGDPHQRIPISELSPTMKR